MLDLSETQRRKLLQLQQAGETPWTRTMFELTSIPWESFWRRGWGWHSEVTVFHIFMVSSSAGVSENKGGLPYWQIGHLGCFPSWRGRYWLLLCVCPHIRNDSGIHYQGQMINVAFYSQLIKQLIRQEHINSWLLKSCSPVKTRQDYI